MLLLGAGGSSLALTLYLHNKKREGRDVPSSIVVTNHQRAAWKRCGRSIAKSNSISRWNIIFHRPPKKATMPLSQLVPPASMVINATGLGKDRARLTADRCRGLSRERHCLGFQLPGAN
ncbi:MAG: hypothetical protein R2844_10870 [Caldilineales bacterium]